MPARPARRGRDRGGRCGDGEDPPRRGTARAGAARRGGGGGGARRGGGPGPALERCAGDRARRVRIGREVAGTAVRLEPLSGDALRDLAHWALPQYNELELDRLARRVGTDSAGIPLLAVELLHAVAMGLDLRETRGAWPEPFKTLDQTLPGELPDAVVAAIRIGFRRLP